MACLIHKWNGCKCEKCGKTRSSNHRFVKVDNACIGKCKICGHEQAVNHIYIDGICSCGDYQTYVGYFLVGEKPDLAKKDESIADILRPYDPSSFQKNIQKEKWSNWNDSQITLGLSTAYQIFFKAFEQLISTNPRFAEQAKPIGTLSTATMPERRWDGALGVVDDLDSDFIIELDKYLNGHKEIAFDSDFYYMHGNEQFTQPSQISFSYVPKWKIAIYFYHKKISEYIVHFERFHGSGVCDVCNKPLGDVTAYIVPNDTFYNSPRYRIHFRNHLRLFSSEVASDAMAEQMFADMQRKDAISQGSAVCENCIHMFG